MVWNHRVIETDYEWGQIFQIHEVYYDDNGEIELWTQNPMAPMGADMGELVQDLTWMLECTKKPTLNASDLPGQNSQGQ